ncbi:MAG TPA: hypothetical protein DCR23_00170 [Ruminococcaceae bacterium]|nr:hypothetical protein [Oscillospiraceae bacterium]
MALNYEKYAAEHDAIIGYYKPIMKKNYFIGLVLGIIALFLIVVALYLIFHTSPENKNGLIGFGLLIVASILSSIMGKFKRKKDAAKRAMYNELDQLEFARKQASISD